MYTDNLNGQPVFYCVPWTGTIDAGETHSFSFIGYSCIGTFLHQVVQLTSLFTSSLITQASTTTVSCQSQ